LGLFSAFRQEVGRTSANQPQTVSVAVLQFHQLSVSYQVLGP
jgi:hypothetical protein